MAIVEKWGVMSDKAASARGWPCVVGLVDKNQVNLSELCPIFNFGIFSAF